MHNLPPVMPRIVVIAKAPKPGFAKTRLIPALGEAGSAQMAERLLGHALNQAVSANLGPVELCFAPDNWDCQTLFTNFALTYSPQGDGDLGARMARAAQRALAENSAVILMGTDCPALTAVQLQTLAAQLQHHQACMIPATDGGYVALALRQFDESIFTDIAWSTEQVAEQTRARFNALGWQWSELSALADIDEPEDLHHLPDPWQQEFGLSEV